MMFLFNIVSVSLTIGGLFPSSIAKAIPQGPELHFATNSTLDDTSNSDDPKVSSRGLEVHFATNPELDKASGSNITNLSSRGVAVNFATDPGLDEAPDPHSTNISSRGTEDDSVNVPREEVHFEHNTSHVVSRDLSELDQLLKNDQFCAHRKNWHRSLDVKKRADTPGKPSNVLWNVGQAIVVNMGMAQWQTWGEKPDAIGTTGLCGCTAVAIVAKTGAIVAHITPNQQQFKIQMDNIRNLFDAHVKGLSNAVFVMAPTLDGVVRVQQWQTEVQQYLWDMGLSSRLVTYATTKDAAEGHFQQGTALVQNLSGKIRVWLDDGLLAESSTS